MFPKALLEVSRVDQPAHQPAAPEKLFENGHGDDADGHAEQKKQGIDLRSRGRVPGGMAHDRVVEKDGMVPAGHKPVRRDPEDEYSDANQNALERPGGPPRSGFRDTARIAAMETANRSQTGTGTTVWTASKPTKTRKGRM